MAPTDPAIDAYAAALDGLAAFLLSDQVIWPLDRKAGPHPDLSLGGLLLLQDELKSQSTALPSEERRRLESLDERWQEVLREQPVALGRKAVREQSMRLHLWSAYLADLKEGTAAADDYSQQVRQRAMLERLGELSSRPPATEPFDQQLRSSFQPGPFVWAPGLEPVYPKDRYWFLYGRPSGPC